MSFSFNISPPKEHPGLISLRMDRLDLLAVQGTLKSLLQHHSSKASILLRSALFIVQLSHPYVTTGKTIALTRRYSRAIPRPERESAAVGARWAEVVAGQVPFPAPLAPLTPARPRPRALHRPLDPALPHMKRLPRCFPAAPMTWWRRPRPPTWRVVEFAAAARPSCSGGRRGSSVISWTCTWTLSSPACCRIRSLWPPWRPGKHQPRPCSPRGAVAPPVRPPPAASVICPGRGATWAQPPLQPGICTRSDGSLQPGNISDVSPGG